MKTTERKAEALERLQNLLHTMPAGHAAWSCERTAAFKQAAAAAATVARARRPAAARVKAVLAGLEQHYVATKKKPATEGGPND